MEHSIRAVHSTELAMEHSIRTVHSTELAMERSMGARTAHSTELAMDRLMGARAVHSTAHLTVRSKGSPTGHMIYTNIQTIWTATQQVRPARGRKEVLNEGLAPAVVQLAQRVGNLFCAHAPV